MPFRRRIDASLGYGIGGRDGPEFEAYEVLAGHDRVVQLVGQRLDVPDILNAADAVCLSSRAEGAPMVLLEAMSLGKPIVAPDVGGIPEAVVNEETGLLVPVGDADALATRFSASSRVRHSPRIRPGRSAAPPNLFCHGPDDRGVRGGFQRRTRGKAPLSSADSRTCTIDIVTPRVRRSSRLLAST